MVVPGMLTEAGGPYLVSSTTKEFLELAVAKIDFGRITGIREIPAYNVSEVQYTEKIVKITPVGEIYSDIVIGKSYNASATFIKYNDGWRMEKISTNSKKITIQENINQSSVNEELANVESKKIRLDGIFQSQKHDYGQGFFRFYPDGTVINVSSTGEANQVINWLKKETSTVNRGKYVIKSDKIHFTTTSANGTITYEGTIISDTRIILKTKSYINAYESDEMLSFFHDPPRL